MDWVQAAELGAIGDGTSSDAANDELAPGHHAVLAFSQGDQRPFALGKLTSPFGQKFSLSFGMHRMHKLRR